MQTKKNQTAKKRLKSKKKCTRKTGLIQFLVHWMARNQILNQSIQKIDREYEHTQKYRLQLLAQPTLCELFLRPRLNK